MSDLEKNAKEEPSLSNSNVVFSAHALLVRSNLISLGLICSTVLAFLGLYYMPDDLVSVPLVFVVILYAAVAICCSINVAFMGMASQLGNTQSKSMAFFTYGTIIMSLLSLLAAVVLWSIVGGNRYGVFFLFVVPAISSIFISMKIVVGLEKKLK